MLSRRAKTRFGLAAAAGAAVVVSFLVPGQETRAAVVEQSCEVPADGVLTMEELPEGSDAIDCDAVGRVVSSADGLQATVPPPGITLTVEEVYPDDSSAFEVAVSDDGEVSYASDAEDSEPSEVPRVAPSSPPECDQTAYNTADRKEYGTYEIWIGDGSFPAALTRDQFQAAVARSVENIIRADNNCGLEDRVSASGSLAGRTDYESDMSPTSCGDDSYDGRDHKSVWDAGNLDGTDGKSPPVARMCAWTFPTPGAKNDLLEADVRFNITNYNFTIYPNRDSCHDDYDVVSVGTHEAGHVYGMAHVSEADYPWMTMSTNAEECDATARSLGKGDVRGLESMY